MTAKILIKKQRILDGTLERIFKNRITTLEYKWKPKYDKTEKNLREKHYVAIETKI